VPPAYGVLLPGLRLGRLGGPLLSFNSAVWRFRNPAHASRLTQPREWLIARIVDLANSIFNSIKPAPTRKRKLPPSDDLLDREESLHNALIDSASTNTAICYTDGSASPNPGPSGAAACIFLQNPNLVIDVGISLGKGSNNAAEIRALNLLFDELIGVKAHRHSLVRAIVFSDSLLAINACTSARIPKINRSFIDNLRVSFIKLSALMEVKLQWVRGHSNHGGNERVDKVAKSCASLDTNISINSTSDWPFSGPIYSVPLHGFLRFTPTPCLRGPPLAVGPTSSVGPQTVASSDRPAPRRSSRLSPNLGSVD
jgi:ribonuclease HI